VTRLSRAMTAKDITDRIARAFSGQYGLGDAENLAVILDRDILSVDSETIGDTVVLATYLDGCLVYSAMPGVLWDERECIRERLRRY